MDMVETITAYGRKAHTRQIQFRLRCTCYKFLILLTVAFWAHLPVSSANFYYYCLVVDSARQAFILVQLFLHHRLRWRLFNNMKLSRLYFSASERYIRLTFQFKHREHNLASIFLQRPL